MCSLADSHRQPGFEVEFFDGAGGSRQGAASLRRIESITELQIGCWEGFSFSRGNQVDNKHLRTGMRVGNMGTGMWVGDKECTHNLNKWVNLTKVWVILTFF